MERECRQEADRWIGAVVQTTKGRVRPRQSGFREFHHTKGHEDGSRRRREPDVRPHHHRHRIASDRRPQPQTRQPAPHGFHRRSRSARHSEDAPRDRRRLHRIGVGIGVRHARYQGDLRRNDAWLAARRRPRPGAALAQASGKTLRRDPAEYHRQISPGRKDRHSRDSRRSKPKRKRAGVRPRADVGGAPPEFRDPRPR